MSDEEKGWLSGVFRDVHHDVTLQERHDALARKVEAMQTEIDQRVLFGKALNEDKERFKRRAGELERKVEKLNTLSDLLESERNALGRQVESLERVLRGHVPVPEVIYEAERKQKIEDESTIREQAAELQRCYEVISKHGELARQQAATMTSMEDAAGRSDFYREQVVALRGLNEEKAAVIERLQGAMEHIASGPFTSEQECMLYADAALNPQPTEGSSDEHRTGKRDKASQMPTTVPPLPASSGRHHADVHGDGGTCNRAR